MAIYKGEPQFKHSNGQPCYGCQICLDPDYVPDEPQVQVHPDPQGKEVGGFTIPKSGIWEITVGKRVQGEPPEPETRALVERPLPRTELQEMLQPEPPDDTWHWTDVGECSGCTPPEVLPWCDVHGTPSDAFNAGYQQAESDSGGRIAHVTDESIDEAARWLFRKDAPPGEPADAWDRADESRKAIYRRSAAMIGSIYNGWWKS